MNNSSRESSLGQLGTMENFSGVPISLQERTQYVSLRETNCGLSDQRLLAEIIAKNDPSKLVAFWNSYENIFLTELAELDKLSEVH